MDGVLPRHGARRVRCRCASGAATRGLRSGCAHHQRRLRQARSSDAAGTASWYRRGYYDDGTPLGSRDSDECRIDALAQAWAVLSGAAPRARCEQAMDAVDARAGRRGASGCCRLLTPPFDRTPHDPGYIKGYLPGCARTVASTRTRRCGWWRALARLGAGTRRARAARDAEPGEPHPQCGRRRDLPGRALRDWPPTCPTIPQHRGRGGLDLVHRLGRLDAARDAGGTAGVTIEEGRNLRGAAEHSSRLAGLPRPPAAPRPPGTWDRLGPQPGAGGQRGLIRVDGRPVAPDHGLARIPNHER